MYVYVLTMISIIKVAIQKQVYIQNNKIYVPSEMQLAHMIEQRREMKWPEPKSYCL